MLKNIENKRELGDSLSRCHDLLALAECTVGEIVYQNKLDHGEVCSGVSIVIRDVRAEIRAILEYVASAGFEENVEGRRSGKGERHVG